MKIVPDATVLIRAHNRSKAMARRLLHDILENGHRLVLSNEMIAEVTRVLRYPNFQTSMVLLTRTYWSMRSSFKTFLILSSLTRITAHHSCAIRTILMCCKRPSAAKRTSCAPRRRLLRRGRVVLLRNARDRSLHRENPHGEVGRKVCLILGHVSRIPA